MSDLPLEDTIGSLPVLGSTVSFHGRVWDVRTDEVDLGEAGVVTRDYVDHTGAVGVLALDDHDRVALVHQYRHPVGMRMWEIPAGLLDVDGEAPHLAAAREPGEEADLRAATWHTLIDWVMSPGGTSEAFRCYLARDLSPVPDDERHERESEELGMPTQWFDLDEPARRRPHREACTAPRSSSACSPRTRPAPPAGRRCARPTSPGPSTRSSGRRTVLPTRVWTPADDGRSQDPGDPRAPCRRAARTRSDHRHHDRARRRARTGRPGACCARPRGPRLGGHRGRRPGTWSIAVSPVTAVATAVPSKPGRHRRPGVDRAHAGEGAEGLRRGRPRADVRLVRRHDPWRPVLQRQGRAPDKRRPRVEGAGDRARDHHGRHERGERHQQPGGEEPRPRQRVDRRQRPQERAHRLDVHAEVQVDQPHRCAGAPARGQQYLWYDIDTVKGDKVVAMPKGCHAESPSWYCYDVKVKAHSSRTLVFKAKLGTKHVGHTVKPEDVGRRPLRRPVRHQGVRRPRHQEAEGAEEALTLIAGRARGSRRADR
nr:NUDIX domain-containing protein [Angustibacter aerolatus]